MTSRREGREIGDLGDTVQDRIKAAEESLTRAERQLVAVIVGNYPMSGLGSITRLADSAGVSTPTVARLVQKLGYAGFPEFQEALRGELEARFSDPIAKQETWARTVPEAHILNRFTEKVIENISATLAHIDPKQFDDSVRLLSDLDRKIFVTGGRITHALSEYFYLHMQVIRSGLEQLPSTSNAWPHGLLDLKQGDVLLIYDIRRYENNTLKLAEIAQGLGVEIVLMTDQWQSPIQRYARHTFNCRIEVPSAWDSSAALMLLTETLMAAVQERVWDSTKDRMNRLENMFDQTKIFRKFV